MDHPIQEPNSGFINQVVEDMVMEMEMEMKKIEDFVWQLEAWFHSAQKPPHVCQHVHDYKLVFHAPCLD